MTTRREARKLALQALYEIDAVGREPDSALNHLLGESSASDESSSFTRSLVNGVMEKREQIDATIQRYAPAWPVDQIAVIDRNVLRLAIFEILFDNKVPVKVAVNEATELAKSFGSETSAKFVNGVLGAASATASR